MHTGTIPLTVITGFLGAGKTTLVRALVRMPALARSAVVINEYGEEPIDHALLEISSERIEMLDGGCICCSVRGDLEETLVKLFARRRAGEVIDFERVILETSGLADPAPIIQTLMRSAALERAYRLDGVVTLVDAVNGLDQLDRSPEAVKQVALADRLLITKSDLANDASLTALRERLASANPFALVTTAVHGAIDPALLTDIAPRGARATRVDQWLGVGTDGQAAPLQRKVRHTSGLHTFCLRYETPFTPALLAAWLDTLARLRGPDLLRVKGLVNVVGEPGPVVIHAVQHVRHPPTTLANWPDAERRSRIVFITRGLAAGPVKGLLDGLLALDKGAPTG